MVPDKRVQKAALMFGTFAGVALAIAGMMEAIEKSCEAYQEFSDEIDRHDEQQAKCIEVENTGGKHGRRD